MYTCVCTGSSTAREIAADSSDMSQLLETKSRADSNDITEHSQDDKPETHVSPVCDKRFTNKQHLKADQQSHIGPKFYSCTQCDKRFSLRNSLSHHMNIHKSKYKCTECGKCCGRSSELAEHRRSHSGAVSYTHLTLPTNREV